MTRQEKTLIAGVSFFLFFPLIWINVFQLPAKHLLGAMPMSLWAFYWEVRRQQGNPEPSQARWQQQKSPEPQVRQQRNPSPSPAPVASRVDSKTHRQLLAMVGGDHDVAVRLLEGAMATYPGRNRQWLFERVIADLDRDRR